MRRSLGLPITMAVIMIALVILLLIGWTISTIWAAPKAPTFFWILLPIGAVSLTVILAGVIVYLVLSVKLINLNLRQSNFIDAVTHELKSPLASLKLQIQTLERLNIPEEKRNEMYQAMKNDIDRLEALINQVLMVSVLETKSVKKFPETPVLLPKIIETSISNACTRYKVPRESVTAVSTSVVIEHKRFAIAGDRAGKPHADEPAALHPAGQRGKIRLTNVSEGKRSFSNNQRLPSCGAR